MHRGRSEHVEMRRICTFPYPAQNGRARLRCLTAGVARREHGWEIRGQIWGWAKDISRQSSKNDMRFTLKTFLLWLSFGIYVQII